MNLPTNENLFFKIHYTIRNNSVVVINDKNINNLYNFNVKQELQYDFMKVDINEILSLCNINTYNKILNTQYLNNTSEYLSKNGAIKTVERRVVDKVFVLETLNDYKTIFSNIIGYDISISPVHMTLKEFVGLEVITAFSEKVLAFFREVEENLCVKVNQKEIIYTISIITNIFHDLDILIKRKLEIDLQKYSFAEHNTFENMFLKLRSNPTKSDYAADIQTIKSVPSFYNFLQKMYPETTEGLERLILLDTFEKPDMQVHISPTTCVEDLKFSPQQTMKQFKDLFINNILINFYRNPKLLSTNVIMTIHESMFQMQNAEDSVTNFVYVCGFTVYQNGEINPLPVSFLRDNVSSPVPNLKLLFREIKC